MDGYGARRGLCVYGQLPWLTVPWSPPPRPGSLLALLLTSDGHQSLRIKRNLIATMLFVACSVLIVYGIWQRVAAPVEGYLLICAMLVSCVLFYVALRSGWNQRFSDPSLTLPQILVALTWCACAYGIANEAHGAMLMPLSLVLVFGVFNLSRRHAVIASVYALLCIGIGMLYKALTLPLVYRPHLQAAFFLMTMAIVPTIAGVAAELSRMRQRLKAQKTQLATAMQRFAASGQIPEQAGVTDAHEQGALWRQFAEVARQRRELEEHRNTMLAAISHDLRSPLGRIRMAAELLPSAEGVQVRREAIVRNVNVTNRLLTHFIDMAQAEQEPMASQVDLRALVLEVAAAMPGVQVLELPDQSRWLAPASAVALERALRNLIDNAHVYGQPPVEMGLRCGETTLLWVRDHGPGVDTSLHDYLLQPFTRGESSRLRPGTGLGLAIVHRSVVRHSGRVALASAGPGLRVELHLPQCLDQQIH